MRRRAARAAERNWGLPARTESLRIDYVCSRSGHPPQTWKVHRDIGTRELWFEPRPDALTPEPIDYAEHPRLIFLCQSCRNEVVYTIATVQRHFDDLAGSGRRVVRHDL